MAPWLTALDRELTLFAQRATGEAAEELWAMLPGVLPGLAIVPRLADLVGRVLAYAQATGGPVFRAMSPPYEPEDAYPALLLVTRLGSLTSAPPRGRPPSRVAGRRADGRRGPCAAGRPGARGDRGGHRPSRRAGVRGAHRGRARGTAGRPRRPTRLARFGGTSWVSPGRDTHGVPPTARGGLTTAGASRPGRAPPRPGRCRLWAKAQLRG